LRVLTEVNHEKEFDTKINDLLQNEIAQSYAELRQMLLKNKSEKNFHESYAMLKSLLDNPHHKKMMMNNSSHVNDLSKYFSENEMTLIQKLNINLEVNIYRQEENQLILIEKIGHGEKINLLQEPISKNSTSIVMATINAQRKYKLLIENNLYEMLGIHHSAILALGNPVQEKKIKKRKRIDEGNPTENTSLKISDDEKTDGEVLDDNFSYNDELPTEPVKNNLRQSNHNNDSSIEQSKALNVEELKKIFIELKKHYMQHNVPLNNFIHVCIMVQTDLGPSSAELSQYIKQEKINSYLQIIELRKKENDLGEVIYFYEKLKELYAPESLPANLADDYQEKKQILNALCNSAHYS
jgi:hypothetical protein